MLYQIHKYLEGRLESPGIPEALKDILENSQARMINVFWGTNNITFKSLYEELRLARLRLLRGRLS